MAEATVAYWIKIEFERNQYVVDLDQISTFICHHQGKIDFCLPYTSQTIVVNYHNRAEDYQEIIAYINQLTNHSLMSNWIKIFYERKEYIIDLDRVGSFCYSQRGKISFWLQGINTPIILTPETDENSYYKILNFVKEKTGQSFT
jgi:hypothetical protein